MVRSSRRPFTGRAFLGAVTALTLAVGGLSVAGVSTATSASAADAMLGSVNSARSSAGHSSLAWNSHLAQVAGEQASRMAKKGKLYHNPNLASDVGNYRWVGENVGYGPSSSSIFKAFMKSAPHRANILDDDYTQIGIASVRDDDGRLWVAQVFRQPMSDSSSSSGEHGTSAKKKKSTTKKKSTKKSTTKKRTTTATASAPAKAPEPAAKTTRARTNRPAPVPTLAQRVSEATSTQTDRAGSDPLADALAFAATMNTVGG